MGSEGLGCGAWHHVWLTFSEFSVVDDLLSQLQALITLCHASSPAITDSPSAAVSQDELFLL